MNAVHESDSDSTQVENLTATANGNVTLYAVRTTKAVLDPDVTAQTRTYNGAEQAFTMDGYTISYQQDGQTATPKDAGTDYFLILTRSALEMRVVTLPRKSCTQIDRRSAFSHAALLIYDCDGLHRFFRPFFLIFCIKKRSISNK